MRKEEEEEDEGEKKSLSSQFSSDSVITLGLGNNKENYSNSINFLEIDIVLYFKFVISLEKRVK